MPTRVFVDTVTIKESQRTTVLQPRPEPERIEWGGRILTPTVHDFVERVERERLKGQGRAEADLLPQVAELAKQGRIELVTTGEVLNEYGGTPGSFGRRTIMEGVPIGTVPLPIEYSRIIAGPGGSPREHRSRFIRSVSHPRFLEIARACGAFDGGEPKENTLWDAFHVWSAEASLVPYFLTLDRSLIRRAATAKKTRLTTRLVSPSELMRSATEQE